jgi:hypothetical protein
MKINPLNITATYASLKYGTVMEGPLFIKMVKFEIRNVAVK